MFFPCSISLQVDPPPECFLSLFHQPHPHFQLISLAGLFAFRRRTRYFRYFSARRLACLLGHFNSFHLPIHSFWQSIFLFHCFFVFDCFFFLVEGVLSHSFIRLFFIPPSAGLHRLIQRNYLPKGIGPSGAKARQTNSERILVKIFIFTSLILIFIALFI